MKTVDRFVQSNILSSIVGRRIFSGLLGRFVSRISRLTNRKKTTTMARIMKVVQ